MNDSQAGLRERAAVNEFQTHPGAEDVLSSSASLKQPQASSAESAIEGPTGRIDGDRPAQIKPGTYEVTYVRHEVHNLFGGRAMKLVVWFCVISPGPALGAHVPTYYNVGKADRTARSTSTFKVGFKSDLYRDYVRLADEIPKGRTRISMNGFRDKVIKAQIRFVDRDSKQQPIAESAQYSIIDRLLDNVTLTKIGCFCHCSGWCNCRCYCYLVTCEPALRCGFRRGA